jgi:hypothetical protein
LPAVQQQGRLRLTSFTSNLRAAGMLAALPADSLTALYLSPIDSIGADGRQLSALIARKDFLINVLYKNIYKKNVSKDMVSQ